MEYKKKITGFLLIAVFTAVTIMTGCSKWIEPKSLDFDEGISEPSQEYLSSLRVFKASAHKVSIVLMEAASSQPLSRNHHIMAMPDSVDYICVKNAVKGIFGSVADEIAEVRAKKGTEVLCEVSYTDIWEEWSAIEDAKEDEAAGTEEEYREFVADRVASQLDCCDRYGFSGIVVTYEINALGFHAVGQPEFFTAIDTWRSSHSNHTLIFRGSLSNLIDKSIIDYCKYVIIQVGNAYSANMISSEVKNAFIGVDIGKEKVIVEVSVPNEENPQNAEYIKDYQPVVAAGWVNMPDAKFGRQGIFISNVQEDYFVGNSYTLVRKAIRLMNNSASEEMESNQ